ncbi:MAG: hypothetical protein KGY38_02620, partial [Desulfobacterales bacterium]|nr:hypothetical protein [Desulfobacterales bacterium]
KKDACGALRPVLEKHLRTLCAESGINPLNINITGLIYALSDAKAINRVQKSIFLTWLNLGNAGSHAGDEEITLNDAEYFLKGLAAEVGVTLDSPPEPPITKPKPHREGVQNRKALISAFYLSKFNHDKLGLGNQGDTFTKIARSLSVNRNTLKNYRDKFDPHTGNHRRGWWQVELPPNCVEIFQEFNGRDEPELRRMVLSFIHDIV